MLHRCAQSRNHRKPMQRPWGVAIIGGKAEIVTPHLTTLTSPSTVRAPGESQNTTETPRPSAAKGRAGPLWFFRRLAMAETRQCHKTWSHPSRNVSPRFVPRQHHCPVHWVYRGSSFLSGPAYAPRLFIAGTGCGGGAKSASARPRAGNPADKSRGYCRLLPNGTPPHEMLVAVAERRVGTTLRCPVKSLPHARGPEPTRAGSANTGTRKPNRSGRGSAIGGGGAQKRDTGRPKPSGISRRGKKPFLCGGLLSRPPDASNRMCRSTVF